MMESGKVLNSILIIDDDPVHNFLAQLLFSRLKFSDIKAIPQALDALSYFKDLKTKQAQAPYVIFIDVFMPVMDGFVLLKHLDELEIEGKENCLIIMISASAKHIEYYPETFKIHREIVLKPLTKEIIEGLTITHFTDKQVRIGQTS